MVGFTRFADMGARVQQHRGIWSVLLLLVGVMGVPKAGAADGLDRETTTSSPQRAGEVQDEQAEKPEQAEEDSEHTRRDDLTAQFSKPFRLDLVIEHYRPSGKDSSGSLAATFTAVIDEQHAITTTMLLGDASLDLSRNRGLGDMFVTYSWSRERKIAAAPWIPRTFGPSISVLVPTGDPDKGLGLDTWALRPSLSGFWNPRKDVFILPGIAYIRSFAAGKRGRDLRIGRVFVDASWIHRSSLWVTYVPKYDYDFDSGESVVSHELRIGLRLTKRLSGSVGYEAILGRQKSYSDDRFIGVREEAINLQLGVAFR